MRARWLTWLVIGAPLLWLFGGIVWRGDALDFRDVGHYYRPLWQWTTSEWAAGRIPLWCDLDGLGTPLHADPTAALFYPGQLLFALPCSFTTRLNLYVVLHLLLAAALLYRTARGFGASRAGAVAGGLSYALGGHVLFQYCNPIYLVSAAWLPLAVLAIERTCTRRSWRWALVLAVALALMILGGDPQLAYHVVSFAGLYAWMSLSRAPTEVVWHRRRSVLLLGGIVVAGLLSAVQMLPTAEWSARSERTTFDAPRSLWEVPAGGDVTAGLLGDPEPDSHHERAYDFSVGPWRWLEFVWPNVGGRMFPQHQRWMTAIPAESRIWTPSLYVGLAPLLAALAAFSLRRKAPVTTRWVSWMVLFGVIGSLGVYGLGWLWEEMRCGLLGGDPANKPVHGAVGGLYWLMVVALPQYVQFRYPAKLMVLASLGLSLLAARGWDRLFEDTASSARRWRWTVVALVGGSIVVVAIALWLRPLLDELPGEFPLGPFQPSGVLRDVLWAALQTAVLALSLWLLARRSSWRTYAPALAVILTACDLCIAHGWMISASPPTTSGVTAAGRIERGEKPTPSEWKTTSSPRRIAEVLAWQQDTLGEKCFLPAGVNVVDAPTALEPADIRALWDVLQHGAPHQQQAIRAALGVDAPLVYCPQHVSFRDRVSTRRWPKLRVATTDVFADDPRLDRRTTAIVELDGGYCDANIHRSWSAALPAEAVHLRRLSPTHLEIDTDLPEERLVVIADYYAPGWTVKIIDPVTGAAQAADIHRTNRVLRGVFVPAGKQRVIMHYRPRGLQVGAVISAIGWAAVIATAIIAARASQLARRKL
jgi:hypothetical protein